MSKFLKLFLALIVVAGCSPKENSGNLTISTENGDVRYNVEEAQTPEELEKGLMNRDSLAADSGMIFNLADVENQVAMWMKDTKIPLDMLFVNSNGRIFFIEENATPMSEELIIAPEPALAVIELNAGDVKKHGIKIGDTTEKLLENYDFSMSDAYFDEDTDTTNVGTAYMEKYTSLEDRIRHTDEIPADSYLMIVTWCSYNSDTRKLTMMQGDGTGGVSLYVDGVDVSLTDGVFSVAFGLNQGKVAEILYYGQVPQGEADDSAVSSETDTTETSSESTPNTFLLNLPVTEYSMSNGTRASVIVGKEVLKLSTEEEFVSFVDEKIEGKDYNWFTIDLMDGTGLVFAGCNTTVFDYGEIDKDGALLKSIHTYVRSGDSYELVEQ